jgi:hypothetical protein
MFSEADTAAVTGAPATTGSTVSGSSSGAAGFCGAAFFLAGIKAPIYTPDNTTAAPIRKTNDMVSSVKILANITVVMGVKTKA